MKWVLYEDELIIATTIKLNYYDKKLLELFNPRREAEVPISEIVKQLRTNNQFVYNYIDNLNKKIERYRLKVEPKNNGSNIYILKEVE